MGSSSSKPCHGWVSPCYGGKAKKKGSCSVSTQTPSHWESHREPQPNPSPEPSYKGSPCYGSSSLDSVPTQSPSHWESHGEAHPSPVTTYKGKSMKHHYSSSDSDNSAYQHSDRSGPSPPWPQYASNYPPYESSGSSSYYFSPNKGKGIVIESDSSSGSPPYHPQYVNPNRSGPSHYWPQ